MGFRITVDGHSHSVEIVGRRPHLVVRIDGREHEVSATGSLADGRQTIEIAGTPVHFARAHSGDMLIVRLDGRSETIVTIESMKLQTALAAPRDGRIAALLRREGETFDKDEVIVRLEEVEEA